MADEVKNVPVENSQNQSQDQVPASGEQVGVVKPAWYWIKDTKGQGSVTVTLVFVSFWVTTFAFIASIFQKIGDIQFRSFDSAACAAYLGPILAVYFGRRWTEAKTGSSSLPAK